MSPQMETLGSAVPVNHEASEPEYAQPAARSADTALTLQAAIRITVMPAVLRSQP
ncbi:hypothetical protein PCI56_23000 [Plesiomonas shigelloides subsp. oncorhynchi]|nr:hypothetical protein [Plesiomonas shigelloides]